MQIQTAHLQAGRRQQGSMLLEALFGIVIFAIGILALIGMQASSSRQAVASKYRTDASLLASQFIGQMWMSDRRLTTLQNNFASTASNPVDYQTWRTTVVNTVPGASTKSPTVTVQTDGTVVVTVFWKSPSEPASEPHHNYVTTTLINLNPN